MDAGSSIPEPLRRLRAWAAERSGRTLIPDPDFGGFASDEDHQIGSKVVTIGVERSFWYVIIRHVGGSGYQVCVWLACLLPDHPLTKVVPGLDEQVELLVEHWAAISAADDIGECLELQGERWARLRLGLLEDPS